MDLCLNWISTNLWWRKIKTALFSPVCSAAVQLHYSYTMTRGISACLFCLALSLPPAPFPHNINILQFLPTDLQLLSFPQDVLKHDIFFHLHSLSFTSLELLYSYCWCSLYKLFLLYHVATVLKGPLCKINCLKACRKQCKSFFFMSHLISYLFLSQSCQGKMMKPSADPCSGPLQTHGGRICLPPYNYTSSLCKYKCLILTRESTTVIYF